MGFSALGDSLRRINPPHACLHTKAAMELTRFPGRKSGLYGYRHYTHSLLLGTTQCCDYDCDLFMHQGSHFSSSIHFLIGLFVLRLWIVSHTTLPLKEHKPNRCYSHNKLFCIPHPSFPSRLLRIKYRLAH